MSDFSVGGSIRSQNISFCEGNYYFKSFRGSLVSLLKNINKLDILLPYYYCHEVTEYAKKYAIRVKFYHVNEDLYPILKKVSKDQILVYPNYFGNVEGNILRLLSEYDPLQIIVDSAHSLTHSFNCLATIYSFRKLLPVPDGSAVISASPLLASQPRDSGLNEVSHLIAMDINKSYQEFREQERSVSSFDPEVGISVSSLVGIGCADIDSISTKRRANFEILDTIFKGGNRLPFSKLAGNCPLVYPLLMSNCPTRTELIADRIFTPSYWPIHKSLSYSSFEKHLANEALFLPIDQSISKDSLRWLASRVNNQ